MIGLYYSILKRDLYIHFIYLYKIKKKTSPCPRVLNGCYNINWEITPWSKDDQGSKSTFTPWSYASIQYIFSETITYIFLIGPLSYNSFEAAGAVFFLCDLWIVWCFGVLSDFPNGFLKYVLIRVSYCIIGCWEATENIIINIICLIKSSEVNSWISEGKLKAFIGSFSPPPFILITHYVS